MPQIEGIVWLSMSDEAHQVPQAGRLDTRKRVPILACPLYMMNRCFALQPVHLSLTLAHGHDRRERHLCYIGNLLQGRSNVPLWEEHFITFSLVQTVFVLVCPVFVNDPIARLPWVH